jgi:hypothetical protein
MNILACILMKRPANLLAFFRAKDFLLTKRTSDKLAGSFLLATWAGHCDFCYNRALSIYSIKTFVGDRANSVEVCN